MIRSIIASLLIFAGLTFVETTWLHAIAFQSVRPDLSLIFLIYVSFHNPKPIGQVTGFLSGMLHDGISALPFGTSSLIRSLISSAFNSIAGKFYIDRIVLPIVFALLATLFKAGIFGLLFVVFGSSIQPYDFLGKTVWIEAAYTGLVSPLVFLILTPLRKLIIIPDKRT